jgi:hypothetical protein
MSTSVPTGQETPLWVRSEGVALATAAPGEVRECVITSAVSDPTRQPGGGLAVCSACTRARYKAGNPSTDHPPRTGAAMHVKYSRTPHLPWSPGRGADDLTLTTVTGLVGHEVVVTEKLDGENTSMYDDGLHARSLDSGHHASRSWVKALHARIRGQLPPGRRICGENMYARHSLPYDNLVSWFYGFSVWDAERCLDWDSTTGVLASLGIPTPPTLWRGLFDEVALRALRIDPVTQEGYVVRTVDGFDLDGFGDHVAKWVRSGHVQTSEHWMRQTVVVNGLAT